MAESDWIDCVRSQCLCENGMTVDYSAVCDRLRESGGRLQHLCSGLGRSGVKLNRKQTWPRTVQYKDGSTPLHV